jgi:hypothetical protein
MKLNQSSDPLSLPPNGRQAHSHPEFALPALRRGFGGRGTRDRPKELCYFKLINLYALIGSLF